MTGHVVVDVNITIGMRAIEDTLEWGVSVAWLLCSNAVLLSMQQSPIALESSALHCDDHLGSTVLPLVREPQEIKQLHQ